MREGVLASPAPGATASVGLRAGPWLVELSLATPFATSSGGAATAEVVLALTSRVAACVEWRPGRWTVGGCAVATGGVLTGRGATGLEAPTSGSAGYLAVGGGGLARLRVFSKLSLRLDADVGAAAVRPRFVAQSGDGVLVLAAPQPWWFASSLGKDWAFE